MKHLKIAAKSYREAVFLIEKFALRHCCEMLFFVSFLHFVQARLCAKAQDLSASIKCFWILSLDLIQGQPQNDLLEAFRNSANIDWVLKEIGLSELV